LADRSVCIVEQAGSRLPIETAKRAWRHACAGIGRRTVLAFSFANSLGCIHHRGAPAQGLNEPQRQLHFQYSPRRPELTRSRKQRTLYLLRKKPGVGLSRVRLKDRSDSQLSNISSTKAATCSDQLTVPLKRQKTMQKHADLTVTILAKRQ